MALEGVESSAFGLTTADTVKKTSAAMMALTILLAGCGGGAKPDASPTSTTGASPTITTPAAATTAPTSPSASPSTTDPKTDPNIPAAARAHTPAGAEAFTRYFIERWNVAWTEPQAGILLPLCQPTSKACAAFEKTATRLAKEAHRYDGNPVTIKFVGTLDATNPNKYDVLANLVQERRSEIDAAGKIYVTDKREDFRVNFELLYTGHTWSAATIKIMK